MTSKSFHISQRAIVAAALTLAWILLPPGIYLSMNGSIVWGGVLTVVALLLVGVASARPVREGLVRRAIPISRGYFMAFGFFAAVLLTAMNSVLLFQPEPGLAAVGAMHAAGIVVVGIWASIELLGAIRKKSS